jgi:hypothetical protein
MAQKIDRRRFIKLAGTTAFAVSISSVLGGCDAAPSEPSSPSSSASSEAPSSSSSSSNSESSSSSDTQPQKIIWTTRNTNDGNAILTGYDSSGAQPMGVITLPEKWSGRKIVELDGNLGGKITKMIVPGCYKKVHYGGSKYLEELILNEGVETIYQFDGSINLRNVQLPSTLKEIGSSAFLGCTSLTSIRLPESLETLGWHAFTETGLTEITVPASVVNYDFNRSSAPFYNCEKLVSATVKGSVLSDSMFEACPRLKNVSLNDTILEIPRLLFKGCSSLASITLPKKLKSIGSDAFRECKKLTSISIPETVTEIGDAAFMQSALQKIVLPNNLQIISWAAFRECSALKAVYIPVSVSKIENNAFDKCPQLSEVYYPANEAQWSYIDIGEYGNNLLKAANMHYYASPNSLR